MSSHGFLLLHRHGVRYRVGLAVVDSVQEAPDISAVPLAPRGVSGLFVAQGQFVGVIDLGELREVPLPPITPRLMLVARVSGGLVALAADSVESVVIDDIVDTPESSRMCFERQPDGSIQVDLERLVPAVANSQAPDHPAVEPDARSLIE